MWKIWCQKENSEKPMRPRTKLSGRFLTQKIDGLISLDRERKAEIPFPQPCVAAQ